MTLSDARSSLLFIMYIKQGWGSGIWPTSSLGLGIMQGWCLMPSQPPVSPARLSTTAHISVLSPPPPIPLPILSDTGTACYHVTVTGHYWFKSLQSSERQQQEKQKYSLFVRVRQHSFIVWVPGDCNGYYEVVEGCHYNAVHCVMY